MMESMQVDRTDEEETSPAPERGQPLDAASKTGEVTLRGDGREENKRTPAHMQMLTAFVLTGYRMYEGTVPRATVVKRRMRNKMARLSRRANRK